MHTNSYVDQFQQLSELNRVFLGLLQTRACGQRPCLGLPLAMRAVVRAASSELLDGVADFPRALFRLRIESRLRVQTESSAVALDEAEHDLSLSILFAARQTSRQSVYQARLLFGFETAEVQQLVGLQLPELQQLACAPGLLHCAFTERQWFWHGLFAATRPESRRQLTLMALQPAVGLDWPQRRPPHPTA